MKTSTGKVFAISAFTIFIALLITSFVAYFINISKFAQLDFERPYKTEIVRGAGIIVPMLGVFTGFMTINDN